MSEASACRLNKQDLLIAKQLLQTHFTRSEFTLWPCWILFFALLQLISYRCPQSCDHHSFCFLGYYFSKVSHGKSTCRNQFSFFFSSLPFLVLFFFSYGSHSRWINGSCLWRVCCSQMQGWVWLVWQCNSAWLTLSSTLICQAKTTKKWKQRKIMLAWPCKQTHV